MFINRTGRKHIWLFPIPKKKSWTKISILVYSFQFSQPSQYPLWIFRNFSVDEILFLCATSSRTEAPLLREDCFCHFVQMFDRVGNHLQISYTWQSFWKKVQNKLIGRSDTPHLFQYLYLDEKAELDDNAKDSKVLRIELNIYNGCFSPCV